MLQELFSFLYKSTLWIDTLVKSYNKNYKILKREGALEIILFLEFPKSNSES